MAQIVIPNGELMGAPGAAGAPGVYAFADYGDPNVRPDPQSLLANCQLGSTYQRIDGTGANFFLYVKTGVATGANPQGVWTNK